jgi:prepilin-type N-terminal cleavage/methylation domain-containing protein
MRSAVRSQARGGFSLVELLTVIFIIALLIGILIPSLNAARNAAKKTSSKSMLNSVGVGLEMFKNDNGPDFPQTNGYPPSFSHPPLSAFNYGFDANLGEFPFIDGNPVVYGAQWLPAMLMGVDNQGFIKKSAVPRLATPLEVWKWYTPEAMITERAPLYVSPENAPIRKTEQLPGRKPESSEFFPNWDQMKLLPFFVDAWDQAILYSASNTAGKATNMVENSHNPENSYDTGEQGKGPPFYFHKDNEGFTGRSDTNDPDAAIAGWDFANSGGKHAISFSGADLTADLIIKLENKNSFAHYTVDRKIYSNLLTLDEQRKPIDPKTPLRPVNAQSFLLVSPGVDGKYGTNDDVSNIPGFED